MRENLSYIYKCPRAGGGRPRAARTMLNYIEFYGASFGRDVISADSSKIEGIEGNSPIRRF